MQQGLTEEMYAHVHEYEDRGDYSEQERLAIQFAERFALEHRTLGSDFFAEMRRHFTDVEILELATTIAFCLGIGRVYTVLDIANECPVTMK
jgi:alkylhydroperoxidase family enzyme|tara:strand:+ start:666 stop:941 length:276 start_codon:yes stop_codon:yes gene_type:complete